MIANGIKAAIAVLYDALAAMPHPERASDRTAALLHLRRAGIAIQALEAEAERVATMETSPIPPHWRQQPVALADYPANVVPLRPVRHIVIRCN